MELGRRSFRVYPLRYSEYVVAREEDLARERALAERQQDMVAKTEDFIRKNIAGQKTKQAQSRRKMLDKLDRLERPEDVWAAAERVAFRFAPARAHGRHRPRRQGPRRRARRARALRGRRAARAPRRAHRRRRARTARARRTLLKLLAGRGRPGGRGRASSAARTCRRATSTSTSATSTRALTAVDNVRRVRGDFTVEAARQYLARFRFWGDDPLRVVSGFSGGERSRLALAKLLLEPRNLLFLDEPTNHLDIPAAEILEEALVGFEGTVHPRLARPPLPRERDDAHRARARRARRGLPRRLQGLREARVAPARRPSAATAKGRGRQARRDREARQERTAASALRRGEEEAKQKYEEQATARRAPSRRRSAASRSSRPAIAAGEKELGRAPWQAQGKVPGDDWEKLAKMAHDEQALTKKVDSMLLEWARLSEEVQ